MVEMVLWAGLGLGVPLAGSAASISKEIDHLLQAVEAQQQQGNTVQAISLMQEWRQKHLNVDLPVDFYLYYVGLLLKTNQMAEAFGILHGLKGYPLTASQQQKYYDLELDYAYYRAAELQKNGDITTAYEAMAPVLVKRPDHPEVLSLLKAIESQNIMAFQHRAHPGSQMVDGPRADHFLDLNTRTSSPMMASANTPEIQTPVNAISTPASTSSVSQNVMTSSAPNPFTPISQPEANRKTELQREYDAIMAERSATLEMGFNTLQRQGTAGESKLSYLDEQIKASVPAGDGKFQLVLTPVQLSAGQLGRDEYSLGSFGGGPAAAEAQLAGKVSHVGRQKQSGVGANVKYINKHIEIDVGTTPVGFTYTNFTGGLKASGTLDTARTIAYKINLSHRPVTESLLSFAGTKDIRTAQKWGGVSAVGIRADLSKEFGTTGVYGAIAWHALRGHDVASNQRKELNVGGYQRLIDQENEALTVGLNMNTTFFDNNQNHFTYGHGGYFSPQASYGLAFPINWAKRNDKISIALGGSLGVTHFKEDKAKIHPTNASLQAQSISAINRSPNQLGMANLASGFYPSQTKTSLSYGLNAAVAYRATPQILVGANAALDNASDYKQWAGGLFLRYYFYPQSDFLAFPINNYQSTYDQKNTYGQ